MAQSPQVSVIIPTCGRPGLLLECVESILRNDFTDFEILVVDQDPKKSLEAKLARRFNDDPRIVYLFLDQAGASRARNMGIEHARGEIIAFVDDDVKVDPSWLMAYVDAFTTVHPTPGVLAGRLDPLWLSPRPEWYPEEREYLLGIYNKGEELMPMPEGDLPLGGNFAVLRKIVDEGHRFDKQLDYSYSRQASKIGGEDSLFSLRIKQANYAIYYQPRARAWHRISKDKLTKKYFFKRHFEEGIRQLSILHLSGSVTPDDFPGIIRWHIRRIVGQVWRFFRFKDKSGANLTQAKAWMRLAAECLYSLGIVYCALKLLWTQELP